MTSSTTSPTTSPGLTPAEEFDAAMLRQAFSCFPSGVAAVCAAQGRTLVGMAASSFTSVSLDPPLVSVCIDRASTTWPKLRESASLGVSVLGENHDRVCRQLASKSADRFADLDLHLGNDGALLVADAVAWLECQVHSELPAGDHTIVLLEVTGLKAMPEASPLVFHLSRFRRLVAPETAASPAAPGSAIGREHGTRVLP